MSDIYFPYEQCIKNSEKICWKIDELLPDDFVITYDKNFLPTRATGEDKLPFLTAQEKKHLNHIWGASYFNIFAFVEEYITVFMLSVARDASFSNASELRAFARFSEEEIKHQQLFKKYLNKFKSTFITDCEFIENAAEVASTILSNTKLCVLVLTYHLELITQQHYTETIRQDEAIDEKVKDILKHHWLEESQHAKLDLNKLNHEADKISEDDFMESLTEYFLILDAFAQILKVQCEMNWESLRHCSESAEKYNDEHNKAYFIENQHQAYVNYFIVMGLENKNFLYALAKIAPRSIALINQKKSAYVRLYDTVTEEGFTT